MTTEAERAAHIDQALEAVGGDDAEFYLSGCDGGPGVEHAVRLTCRYQGCKWGEYVGEMELWEFVADARAHWEENHVGPVSSPPYGDGRRGIVSDDGPRAKTAEEIRDDFLDTCRALADFWATAKVDTDTCHHRLSGLVHSILCIFDGVNGGMPAFDIVAQPHPDDKDYHRAEGEDWIEPGTVINDCMLHELLYRADLGGVWHKNGR